MSDVTRAYNYLLDREEVILRAATTRLACGKDVDLSDLSHFAAEIFNIGVGCHWRDARRRVDVERTRTVLGILCDQDTVVIVRHDHYPRRVWYMTTDYYNAFVRLQREYGRAHAALSA